MVAINKRITENENFIDMDDKVSSENRIRKVGSVRQAHCVTYESFYETLKHFEVMTFDDAILKKMLNMLLCYHERIDCVDFYKFLANLIRFKSQIDTVTSSFFPEVMPKKEISAMTKEEIASKIQRIIRKKLKAIRDKGKVEKARQEELEKEFAGNDIEIDLKNYTYEEIVKQLRNCVEKSINNPRDIPKICNQVTNDLINLAKYKDIVIIELGWKVSPNFIEQSFEMFDIYYDNKFSYDKFLKTLYGQLGHSDFTTPEPGEALLEHINKCAKAHFASAMSYLNQCRHTHPSNVTVAEFRHFISAFTRQKHYEIEDLYNFLDNEKRGILQEKDVLRLYEYEGLQNNDAKQQRQASGIMAPNDISMGEISEGFKSFDLSGFEIGGLGDKKPAGGFGDGDFIGARPQEDSMIGGGQGEFADFSEPEMGKPVVRLQIDEIEEMVMKLSVHTMGLIKYHGKNIKDLFFMFADKLTRLMHFDEFVESLKFITNDMVINEEVAASCYQVFLSPTSKKLSYSNFLKMVELGKKMNPLYIKVKNKYGENMGKYKTLYREELQRLDLKTGKGLVNIIEVRKLFAINRIDLTDLDCEFLKEEGIIVQGADRSIVCNTKRLLEKVFPEISEVQVYIQNQSARKLQNRFRKYKAFKQVRKREDDLLNLLAFGDESVGGGKDSMIQKQSTKHGRFEDTKKPGRMGTSKRFGKASMISSPAVQEDEKLAKLPKQVFEFEDSKDTPSNLSRLRTTGAQATKKGVLKKTPEEKIVALMPTKPRHDPMTTVLRQKMTEAIKKILMDIANQAVGYGESLLLSKSVHERYAQRPVIKDTFVLMEESSYDAIDIMPNSLSCIPQMGKLFYMNTDGVLYQVDIVNNMQLSPINLSSRVPMRQSKILDYILEPETGNLFILKDNWLLEVWDTLQAKSAPVQKIRLVQEDTSNIQIDSLYRYRHYGKFPNFLSLSTHNKNLLVVNTTCINGSIMLIDSVSLSIQNQIFFRPEDLRIPLNINKILYSQKGLFEEINKNQQTFDKIFANEIKIEGETKKISKEAFSTFLNSSIDLAACELNYKDIDNLVAFIEQDNDGFISDCEWNYLQEMLRFSHKKSSVHISCEIPEQLKNMNLQISKIFQRLYDFIKKSGLSIKECFAIFDQNNSGKISGGEFFEQVTFF